MFFFCAFHLIAEFGLEIKIWVSYGYVSSNLQFFPLLSPDLLGKMKFKKVSTNQNPRNKVSITN